MTAVVTADEPRVWVGCLGCYNAGTLAGQWFDAVDAPESMEDFDEALGIAGTESWQRADDASGPGVDRIKRIVSDDHGHPVYGPHEELWVMEHENFRGLLTGECSPSTAKAIAEKLADVDLGGRFDAWMTTTSLSEYSGDVDDLLAAYEEAVMVEGDSFQDAAHNWLDETGAFEGLPERWESYDWHLAGAWLSSNENGGAITTIYHNGTHWLLL